MLLERVGERATLDGFSMGFCIGSMMAARVFVRIVEDVRSSFLSFFFSTLRRARIFYSSLISLEI